MLTSSFVFFASCRRAFLAGAWCVLGAGFINAQTTPPIFNGNVTVHDPSVVRVGNVHYVFGSHLAAARSNDFINWAQLSSATLFPDPSTTFAEAIAWAGAANHWAPDVHRMDDGRYYFYYCVSAGDSPRSALGIAVADTITGPYVHETVLLRSGMWNEISHDGTIYNANRHPNAVDPTLFRDANGLLWMVYGSYSGGIFILRMDPANGRPLAGQGYGKKLIGGNHSRIEAPYILHHPGTGYYYLFLSFGGLDSFGGYQVRVGRSLTPDGPYLDPAGTDLVNVRGPNGSFFDDAAIAPHGAKLIGNYRFLAVPGEPRTTSRGYLSPGHNSASYDAASGRMFMFFHTRFVGRGEQHEVRVHQLYMSADGWPVVAPHRYAGESPGVFTAGQIPGRFKLINHGKDISTTVHESVVVELTAGGTVTGGANGTWTLNGDNFATLVLDGVSYRGVFSRQWDDDQRSWVLAFSALSNGGVSVWGSKVAAANTPPSLPATADVRVRQGETLQKTFSAIDPDAGQLLSYSLTEAPTGASIDPAIGVLSWTPLLAQVGGEFDFTVRVADNGADPGVATTSFRVQVDAANVVRRTRLDFTTPGTSGLRDATGAFTGLTTRLPGTGTNLPSNDPLLTLNTTGSVLALTSTQADYNGGAGLATNRSVGLALAELGFTGTEDFAVTAEFRPPPSLGAVDQVGLFVGANGGTLTRAGIILFGAQPEAYAVHTQAGTDTAGRFGGALNANDGLSVTIQRQGGAWRTFVNGLEWNPQIGGIKNEATFLDARADLVAGVFAITPFNTTAKTVMLDALTVLVDFGAPPTMLETWRTQHFGPDATEAVMADEADPDGDGLPNLLEYALGSTPLDGTSAASPTAGAQVVAETRHLTLAFNRIPDPTLHYAVQAADSLAGPWSIIWQSSGETNTAGPVTVFDPVALDEERTSRFMRLRVER